MSTLEAMAGNGKRVRVHDDQMVLKLPSQVKDMIVAEAGNQSVTSSTIVRRAVADYLAARGYGG